MTSTASAQSVALRHMLSWPPEGAGDFADVAWVVAKALGNGSGVRCLEVRRFRSVSAHVLTTGPGYVRAVAAEFGWELHEPDPTYATTVGRLGEVRVTVTWIALPDELQTSSSGCGP